MPTKVDLPGLIRCFLLTTMILMRRLITFLAAGFSLLAAQAFAQDAKIVKIVGGTNATITRSGAAMPATEGMAISLSDEIATGAGTELYVQAYPGAIATIKPNSKVIVEKLAASQALLDLKEGNVVSQLDPKMRASHDYGIRTPKGVAAARGTVYTISVSGVNYTVSTLGGSVSITPVGVAAGGPGSVTLNAGQVTVNQGGRSYTGAASAVPQNLQAAVNQAAAVAVAAVAVVANTPAFGAQQATAVSEISTVMTVTESRARAARAETVSRISLIEAARTSGAASSRSRAGRPSAKCPAALSCSSALWNAVSQRFASSGACGP